MLLLVLVPGGSELHPSWPHGNPVLPVTATSRTMTGWRGLKRTGESDQVRKEQSPVKRSVLSTGQVGLILLMRTRVETCTFSVGVVVRTRNLGDRATTCSPLKKDTSTQRVLPVSTSNACW
jgi:hypothetical protein